MQSVKNATKYRLVPPNVSLLLCPVTPLPPKVEQLLRIAGASVLRQPPRDEQASDSYPPQFKIPKRAAYALFDVFDCCVVVAVLTVETGCFSSWMTVAPAACGLHVCTAFARVTAVCVAG